MSIFDVRTCHPTTWCMLLLFSTACYPDGIDKPMNTTMVVPNSEGIPNRETDIHRALVSSDATQARAILEQLRCNGDFQPVRDVARAWRETELPGTGAGSAITNPYIRALAANCLIESGQYSTSAQDSASMQAARESAARYLRVAMRDPRLVALAMGAIMPVATASDISAITDIAAKNSSVAAIAVTALSESCDPSAVLGISKLRSQYAGSAVGATIEAFMSGNAYHEQMSHCDRRPSPPSLAGRPQKIAAESPSVFIGGAELARDLRSPSITEAREAIRNHVDCVGRNAELLAVLRDAWRMRGIASASGPLRDLAVQTEIAKCLIEATDPADPDRPSAVSFLRSHMDTNDALIALACAIGLARNEDPNDVDRIVDVANRIPAITNFLAEYLAVTCGANTESIVAGLENQIGDSDRRQRIEAVYRRSSEWRKMNCR